MNQEIYNIKWKDMYITNDYDMFRMSPAQRKVSLAMQKNINDSMDIKELDMPIIINEHNVIIEGHNLYLVRKSRNLPIMYWIMEGATEKEIRMINQARKNWSAIDLLNSHLKCNNKEIEYICKLILKDNNLKYSSVIKIILYNKVTTNKVLEKDLLTENIKDWASISDIKKKLIIYNKYRKYIARNQYFYYVIFNNLKYDNGFLLDNFEINEMSSKRLISIKNTKCMEKEIEEQYNTYNKRR